MIGHPNPESPNTIIAASIHEERLDIQIDTGEELQVELVADEINIDTSNRIASDTGSSEKLLAQVDRSRIDRLLVARFIAALIFVVGIVNLVPAIYHWYAWSTNPLNVVFPKWIFMVIFIAALHLLYSVFVFQVADWSALRAVAVVALIFAGVFGFVFTELVLGKTQSTVANYSGLPASMLKTAIIWTSVMLLLELITCYLTARESFHWQRIERLTDKLATESGTAE